MPDNPEGIDPLLARECRVFTRYLAAQEPGDYVQQKYTRAHLRIPCRDPASRDAVDRILLLVARTNPLLTRVADAYARCFRPNGALRQKLVLLCAVLENSPSTHARLNSAVVGHPLVMGVRLLLAALVAMTALIAGLVLLGPLHLAARMTGGGEGHDAS